MARIKITSYTGSSSNLTIPTTIDGKQVVALGTDFLESAQNSVFTIKGDTVKYIANSAFACDNGVIVSATFPNCVNIGEEAFCYTQLSNLSFPKCKAIGGWAFCFCSVGKVSLPECSHIGYACFYENMNSITELYLPKVSQMAQAEIRYLGSQFSLPLLDCVSEYFGYVGSPVVNLPKCSFVKADYVRPFTQESVIDTVLLDNCKLISYGAFYSCTNLKYIALPKCSRIECDYWRYSGVFQWCVALPQISLPVCEFIGSYTFSNCTSLSNIYMLSNSVATLNATNAFYSCTSLSSIYVPASLVNSYKTATNWSYYSDKIVAFNG